MMPAFPDHNVSLFVLGCVSLLLFLLLLSFFDTLLKCKELLLHSVLVVFQFSIFSPYTVKRKVEKVEHFKAIKVEEANLIVSK